MDFQIIKALPSDEQIFTDIIQTVWEQMEEKSWFVAENADYIHQALSSDNVFGYKAVETETKTVSAVFLAVIPGLDESNLGRDAGMPEAELPLIAHMDTIAVLSAYRGHGLQKRLMEAAEIDLKARGIHFLMCTVHPNNLFSLNNVLSQGYEIVTTKEKYGGKIRAILKKTL